LAHSETETAALAADPALAEKARRAKRICNCKQVDRGTIEDAIRSHGLRTIDEVRARTTASTNCGACAVRIEDIFAELGVAVEPPAPRLIAAE